MTTVSDIIRLALKDAGVIGVGQTASAEDSNDSLDTLNMMLAQWSVERIMCYRIKSMSLTSTGANPYTIGPTGDFVVPERPATIQSAFIRYGSTSSASVDVPVYISTAREDYDRVAVKNISAPANFMFYDAAYPNGNIYLFPIPPASSYQLFISILEQITGFTGLTEVVNLPAEYKAAIRYNLAELLALSYKMPDDPKLTRAAQRSVDVIKTANLKIPSMVIPIASNSGRVFNIKTNMTP